ncbi:MAG: hypothetical protein KY476_18020 [Planctomycetes bacterium]|nr:hypothetical protein [Planctomycetota bacterium]
MDQPLEADRAALEGRALERARQALRLTSATLPHLSGLARLVRIKASDEVSVAAIAASGLLLIRPQVFASVPTADAAYVLAHELLHLALDTHRRQEDDDHPLVVNFAHDYMINDMLNEELERDPPLDGLKYEGAREKSLEDLYYELLQGGRGDSLSCWSPDAAGSVRRPGAGRKPPSVMGRALQDAGLVEPPPPPPPMPEIAQDPSLVRGDLLPSEREPDFEPELKPEVRQKITEQVRRAAAKAASLAKLRQQMQAADDAASLVEPERGDALMQAIRDAYYTPWELALQRWFDAVAPGERTYSRPSRRGADRVDVVLPGRRREGWTLHIIIDTSGSMYAHLPRALGAISAFCDNSGVTEVHVVQCDVEVTRDEWIDPADLGQYRVAGFGYSDMTPAMLRLQEDPNVTAAMMLTDGYVSYLTGEPSYRMLWVLLGEYDASFQPPYGEVIRLESLPAGT